jgi:AraC-like DNA-binding protein
MVNYLDIIAGYSASHFRKGQTMPRSIHRAATAAPGTNLFSPLETFFCELERLAGIGICVHDLRGWTLVNGQRQLPPSRYIHCDPFCMAVKASAEGRLRCGQSDYYRGNDRGRREKRPFLKPCHAGVWEMAVPILRGGQILGSVFCGPVRRTARLPAGLRTLGGAAAGLAALYGSRPLLGERPLRELGRLLHAAIPVMLENTLALVGARRDSNRNRILDWVTANYRGRNTVADLARHLHLSPSRTAHVVRERTGMSLGRLVLAVRMNEARNLLRFTDDRITDVAAQVGFPDSNHFSRVFARHEGISAREFRKQRLHEA